MTSTTTYDHDYPLMTVLIVALASMGFVLVVGTYGDAMYPKPPVQIVYECDFNMGSHILTKPCTTRGVYYE